MASLQSFDTDSLESTGERETSWAVRPGDYAGTRRRETASAALSSGEVTSYMQCQYDPTRDQETMQLPGEEKRRVLRCRLVR
ncbi:hypothetical protein J6590_090053 [Homalodisca vitripennis]|nr:hypothetical protein J6590_090053 [Homalodisca vitripennis]